MDKEKIRAEVERRMNCFKNERNTLLKASDNNLSLGARIAMCEELLVFIDSLQEEPVSKDLLGIATELEETIGTSPHSRLTIVEHLVKAANWQKEKTINKACEFITSNIWEYLTITHCGGEEGVKIDTDRFKKDFHKAMEN